MVNNSPGYRETPEMVQDAIEKRKIADAERRDFVEQVAVDSGGAGSWARVVAGLVLILIGVSTVVRCVSAAEWYQPPPQVFTGEVGYTMSPDGNRMIFVPGQELTYDTTGDGVTDIHRSVIVQELVPQPDGTDKLVIHDGSNGTSPWSGIWQMPSEDITHPQNPDEVTQHAGEWQGPDPVGRPNRFEITGEGFFVKFFDSVWNTDTGEISWELTWPGIPASQVPELNPVDICEGASFVISKPGDWTGAAGFFEAVAPCGSPTIEDAQLCFQVAQLNSSHYQTIACVPYEGSGSYGLQTDFCNRTYVNEDHIETGWWRVRAKVEGSVSGSRPFAASGC